MALLSSPGLTAITMGVTGTKRDDISEMLLASLLLNPNVISAIKVGPEFADTILKWVEDKLNPDTFVDQTPGGLASVAQGTQTQMTLLAADAANLRIGWVLADTTANSTIGGVGASERVQVVNISGTTVTVVRGYDNINAVTAHAQNATWSVVAAPVEEASGLKNDQSRPRVSKQNYVSRMSIDVMISSEQLVRTRRGYAPGVNDELEYQWFQRMEEATRIWNKTVIYGTPYAGANGSAGNSAGDYSTYAGLWAWLSGALNGLSGPATVGTTTVNWTTQGWGTGQVFPAINYANKQLYRNGAYPDWLLCGPNAAQDASRLFADQIRLNQDEMTKGYATNVIRTLMGNELLILNDGQIQDGTGVGHMMLIDSGRVRVRPLADQFCSVITAPTFYDGDTCRAVMKNSLQVNNTGTDGGQAHMLIINGQFTQN